MSVASSLVEVHLLALPVPLAARSQQHFEELMREFLLIADGHQHGHSEHEVPARLMNLVQTLVPLYGAVPGPAEHRRADASARGDNDIDHHLGVGPAAAGPAAQALGDLIDGADEYCRRGRHLLTLATPTDCVAYRRWYLGQVITQLQGAAPIPWTDSDQARNLG